MEEPGAEEVRILFSTAKGESHTHKAGFKQLFRRLRSTYRPDKVDKDDFTLDTLRSAHILVLGGPKEKFTAPEVDMLKKFVKNGGSILILMSEGGEEKAGTNINYFLEQFGMSVNNDAVVRTTHYKYLHPKEVLISDGILNRAVITGAGKSLNSNDDDEFRVSRGPQAFDGTGLEYVFPFGATLSVQKPAVPVLSSGKIAYPMNRPVGAVWAQPGYGRIAVLGSCAMFDDKWLDKEENSKIMDFFFKFLKPVRRPQCRRFGGRAGGRRGVQDWRRRRLAAAGMAREVGQPQQQQHRAGAHDSGCRAQVVVVRGGCDWNQGVRRVATPVPRQLRQRALGSRAGHNPLINLLPPRTFATQHSKIQLNDIDAEEPDVSDLKLLPDTASLADKLKGCLQVRRRMQRGGCAEHQQQQQQQRLGGGAHGDVDVGRRAAVTV